MSVPSRLSDNDSKATQVAWIILHVGILNRSHWAFHTAKRNKLMPRELRNGAELTYIGIAVPRCCAKHLHDRTFDAARNLKGQAEFHQSSTVLLVP